MVKPGYKETEVGVIPEDWEVCQLKRIAPLQRGFDLPYSQMIDGPYPVVFSNGIGAHHNKYAVKGPGVITGRSGTIGKVHYISDDYWPHNTALWVTNFNNNYPRFIYYLFSTINWNLFNSGSGVPTLNRNDIHELKFSIPPEPEQQKIAEALSDMDELIASLEKLIAKKKAIKQGAMQELLTGKKRLPGIMQSMWKTQALKDVCFINPGTQNEIPSNFYYIDLESVVKGKLLTKKYLSKSDAPSRAKREFAYQDILYQTVRPYQKNNLFVDFNASQYIASTGYAVIRANRNTVNPMYLYQYLHTDRFVEDVLDNCTGTSYFK